MRLLNSCSSIPSRPTTWSVPSPAATIFDANSLTLQSDREPNAAIRVKAAVGIASNRANNIKKISRDANASDNARCGSSCNTPNRWASRTNPNSGPFGNATLAICSVS